MGRKTFIRVLALAAMVAAVVTPIATYGRGWDGPRQEAQTEALLALGTAFTFQGSLSDGGSPATGAYDFEFLLWDALAGGTQVGGTQTVGDVAVSGGLFTVTLNFGDVFHGDQHFLEIRVRAGSSVGAYAPLTPRQPLNAVPNASYALEADSANGLQGVDVSINPPLVGDVLRFDGARWAPSAAGGGGLSLPYSAAVSNAAPLITIQNTAPTGAGASALHGKTSSTSGNAFAIIGEVSSTSPGGSSTGVRGINNGTGGSGIGVWGSQDGSGYGVYGETPSGRGVYGTSASGTGVYGSTSSGTGGFFSSGASGTALQVNGAIAVGGSSPAAFKHVAAGGSYISVIDNPQTNGNPNAMLLVTHVYDGAFEYLTSPFSVWYNGSKWTIYNDEIGEDIPAGYAFFVLVINP